MRDFLLAMIRFAVAVVLCLTPVTAIIVMGWVVLRMRRFALLRWWKMAGYNKGDADFIDMARKYPGFFDVAKPPHLVRRPQWRRKTPDEAWFLKRWLGNYLGGLKDNFKTGLSLLLNTWVYSMPVMVLWMFSWWGGWENSFNKGYEQFWVGPLIGWLGVLAFAFIMTWLPLAQVRFAVTGNWRNLYDWRLLRKLARSRWASSVILALVWGVGFAVVNFLRALPLQIEPVFKIDPAAVSATELLDFAQNYYLGFTAIMLVLYLWIHRVSARIYATTVARGVQRGTLDRDALAPVEATILRDLGLSMTAPAPRRGWLAAFAAWAATRMGRIVRFILVMAIWLGVAFSIYFAQFLNHTWINWLNQPVLNAPWVMTVPKPLREAAKEEKAALEAAQKATAPDEAGAVDDGIADDGAE